MADGSSSSGMAAARRGGVSGWLRHVRRLFREIGDAIVSVFFPAGCRICDELLTSASRVPLCAECLASFECVRGILCEVCGRPLPGFKHKPDQPLLCPPARRKPTPLKGPAALQCMKVRWCERFLLLKFEQIEPLGAWFAERLAELVKAEGAALAADVVVPVPLHRERERERGLQPGDASLQPPST